MISILTILPLYCGDEKRAGESKERKEMKEMHEQVQPIGCAIAHAPSLAQYADTRGFRAACDAFNLPPAIWHIIFDYCACYGGDPVLLRPGENKPDSDYSDFCYVPDTGKIYNLMGNHRLLSTDVATGIQEVMNIDIPVGQGKPYKMITLGNRIIALHSWKFFRDSSSFGIISWDAQHPTNLNSITVDVRGVRAIDNLVGHIVTHSDDGMLRAINPELKIVAEYRADVPPYEKIMEDRSESISKMLSMSSNRFVAASSAGRMTYWDLKKSHVGNDCVGHTLKGKWSQRGVSHLQKISKNSFFSGGLDGRAYIWSVEDDKITPLKVFDSPFMCQRSYLWTPRGLIVDHKDCSIEFMRAESKFQLAYEQRLPKSELPHKPSFGARVLAAFSKMYRR